MLKIGITGSMGSGKTTVCRILETLHVPVYYADERAKYLQQHNEELKCKVISAFGNSIYGENGVFDRTVMAGIVFTNPAKLKELENIVFPAVSIDFEKWLAGQNHPYIVKEAALLYEAGTYLHLDKMITVSAPYETRLDRILERDRTDSDQIAARMNRQWPDEKKIAMADYVLYNDGVQLLLPQVLRLHEMFMTGNVK